MPTPDCVVYVDGNRVADDYDRTGDPGAAGEPALLSGLTVRWGRDTTVDQPDPGTATMTLLDPPGGRSFAQLLRVGAALTIEATGPGWTDLPPGESGYGPNTLPWADFESAATDLPTLFNASQGPRQARPTLTRQTGPDPASGAGFARMTLPWAPSGQLPMEATFAPGPYEVAGDAPGGWDGLRRWGTANATWSLTFAFRSWHAQLRAAVSLQQFPRRNATKYLDPVYVRQPSDGAWQRVRIDVPTQYWANYRTYWPLFYLEVLLVPAWNYRLTLGPTWADADCTWEQLGSLDLDDVQLRPDEASEQNDATVLVFAGRITDVSVSLEDEQPVIELTAADLGAELANRVIGDVPWAASTALVRTERILTAAGGGVTLFVDPGARPFPLSFVDVDARSTLELLQEVAESVDGVLWTATHPTTGPYLRLEHSASRAPLFRLQVGPGGQLVVVPAAGARVAQISACDLLAAPARFVQDVADVINVVSVRWLEQTTDDDGKPAPTERAVIVTDPPMIAALGTRRLSLGTILASAAAASAVAAGILARTDTTDYRVSGLLLNAGELPERDQQLVTRLLDGTARNGLPLVLVDLPDWSPAGDAASLYLEGGTYSYVAGSWALDLVVSSAAASGVGLPWNRAGAYRWNDFAPATLWRSLAGVQPVDRAAAATDTDPDPDPDQ